MTFWSSATDAEKVEQIKGAIEVGMNSRQCAMNLGAKYNSNTSAEITAFCRGNGFNFKRNKVESTRRMQEVASAVSGRRAGVPEIEKKYSFKIFADEDREADPLDGLGPY